MSGDEERTGDGVQEATPPAGRSRKKGLSIAAAVRIKGRAKKAKERTKSKMLQAEQALQDFLRNYPRHLGNWENEGTNKWLAYLLGRPDGELIEIASTGVVAGLVSDVETLELTYAGHEEGSRSTTTICLKCPTEKQSVRRFAVDQLMYKKELFFHRVQPQSIAAEDNLAAAVRAAGGSISAPTARLRGCFTDSRSEFTCIVFDDAHVQHKRLDQIEGLRFDGMKELCEAVAELHSSMWKHPLLEHPTVNNPAGQYFFAAHARAAANKRSFFDDMEFLLKEQPDLWGGLKDKERGSHAVSELEPEADAEAEAKAQPEAEAEQASLAFAEVAQLCKTHGNALMDHFETVLDNRPKTLTHQNLCCSNLGKLPGENGAPQKFVALDWQTYSAGAPGLEMPQLLGNMVRLEDYNQIDDLLKHYLEILHRKCPDAKGYTTDMLREDVQIGYTIYAMHFCTLAPSLAASATILDKDAAKSEHRSLAVATCGRLAQALRTLGVAKYLKKQASDLQLTIPLPPVETSIEKPAGYAERVNAAAEEIHTRPARTSHAALFSTTAQRQGHWRRNFLKSNFPTKLGEVVTARGQRWVGELLEQSLESVSVKQTNGTGFIADSALFNLKYAKNCSGPESICLKYPNAVGAIGDMASGLGMCEYLLPSRCVCDATLALTYLCQSPG